MVKALPLHEYLYEEAFPAKNRMEIWMNLISLYNLPFEMETVENLFDFVETVVGEKWENWKTHNDDKYSIYQGKYAIDVQSLLDLGYKVEDLKTKSEEIVSKLKGTSKIAELYNHDPIRLPHTIGEFINDCNRIWKKDLIWDGNLIKRKFNYYG